MLDTESRNQLSFPRMRESNKQMYYVYILASRKNGTLYVGVTRNLIKRVHEHKNDFVEGFTKKYRVHDLVYFEPYEIVTEAIEREKQIKHWNRIWKIKQINKFNPGWKDLYNDIC